MTTPTSGLGSSHSAIVASRASSKPVVPTTQWMFWSMQNRMLSMTTSGRVKSTTTWAPASATSNSQSPGVDHRDELEVVGRVDRLDHLGAHAPAGAEHPDVDQRRLGRGRGRSPAGPGSEVLVVTPSGFPARGPDATPQAGCGSEPVEVGLAIGPDDGQAGRPAEQLGGDRPDLLPRRPRRSGPGPRAPAGTPRRRARSCPSRLIREPVSSRPEDQAALELAAAAGHLLGGEPVGGDAGQLLADQPEHLGHALLASSPA